MAEVRPGARQGVPENAGHHHLRPRGASVDPIASAYRTVKASGITSKDVSLRLRRRAHRPVRCALIKLRGVKPSSAWTPTPAPAAGTGQGAGGGLYHQRLPRRPGGAGAGDHRRRHGRLCPGLRGGRRGAHRRPEDAQKAGTYGITGLYHTLPQVDLGDVVRREIKIFGTICYTRQEFEECLPLRGGRPGEGGTLHHPPLPPEGHGEGL